MLRLKDITKVYQVSSGDVHALKGINICFRKNEFVSILGPSGCGKTTTLNIVGGLDKYTSGDLIIEGQSTKNYSDRDWDVYRNHRIGFVFQSYNLIPHQTVLGNVELALTISGVSKEERVKRAKSALDKVGLKGQYYKRPNQLSGGQCQRVAIARALVNEPDILLADEPTGALDSKTSVQIMELIREISKEKLVIMVTHNAEIAEQYSTRIVRLVDGEIIEDSMPFSEKDEKAEREEVKELTIKSKKKNKAKMSAWTAFKLSMRNLFTKKGRTILTSFAGSIGIIGISLILAVSQGTTAYINSVQESTLSSYPIAIETDSMDLTSLMESFMGIGGEEIKHGNDAVYENPILIEMANALTTTGTSRNDLKSFKVFLDAEMKNDKSPLHNAISGIKYSYDLDLQIYTKDSKGVLIKSDTNALMKEVLTKYVQGLINNGNFTGSFDTSSESISGISSFMPGASNLWQELLSGVNEGELINKLIYDQYELIDGGSWPNDYNEVVLIVNENNELSDLTLYALGLISQEEVHSFIDASAKGETVERNGVKYSYEHLRNMEFKVVLPADKFQNRGDGVYIDTSELLMESLYERSLNLKITGIIKPKADADVSMLSSGIGYTKLLTEHVINKAEDSEVVKSQKANAKIDVLSGLPFDTAIEQLNDSEKATEFKNKVDTLNEQEKASLYLEILCLNAEEESLGTVVEGLKTRFLTDADFKAQVIDGVLTEYAKQLGVEKSVLESYMGQATDEEILVYVTPVFEQMAKQSIKSQVHGSTASLTDTQKAGMLGVLLNSSENSTVAVYYDKLTEFSSSSYEDNLIKFGCLDLDVPFTINIYTSTFENKDIIANEIKQYNKSVGEEQQIHYNDYVGLLMSSVTTIIDAITYVLIAFVSISLVVSSIMISVIVLISVQERTKEIGILRSIGASKRDVSNLFNAETVIIGFSSGLLGVLVTYLLCIPINIILQVLTGLNTLKAILPFGAAIILVVISVLLNFIAGLIPSRSAAKKDPVVALRTE